MHKHRLLNIASDLNEKLIHSDIEGSVTLQQFEDGEFGVSLTYFENTCIKSHETLFIFEHYTTDEGMKTFGQMKYILTGERLVTDERNSDVSNQS
ncbi:hypothetical protein [Staphylococcus parequorum]|uniref:hypothetical protein n=1 Tax=Staphylococcus sp. S9 TaxID=3135640 RepID=UPI003367753B